MSYSIPFLRTQCFKAYSRVFSRKLFNPIVTRRAGVFTIGCSGTLALAFRNLNADALVPVAKCQEDVIESESVLEQLKLETGSSISVVSTVGNVVWIIFGGGGLMAAEYLLAGGVLCLTIVGIPFGFQIFKLAGLSLFPFGSEVVTRRSKQSAWTPICNVLFLPLGVILSLSHCLLAGFNLITIVGVPFAFQHLKLAQLAIWPFGRDVYRVS